MRPARRLISRSLIVSAAAIALPLISLGCGNGEQRMVLSGGGGGGGNVISPPVNGGNTAAPQVLVTGGTSQNARVPATLRTSQTLKVQLVIQPNSGLAWRLDPATASALAAPDSALQIGPRKMEEGVAQPGGALGSVVYNTFTITAVRPTTIVVRFLYDAGLPTSPTQNTFTIDLTAQ